MKAGIIAGSVLVVALVAGYLPRYIAKAKANAAAAEQTSSVPRVQLLTPKVLTSDRDLTLPGTVRALEETIIYSRAAGYVRKWHADIGDKVKEGQLLAEIDTPELDDQIAQAQAQLAEAEAGALRANANHNFSKATLERYTALTPQGVTSQQDLDQKTAQAQVDEAGVTVSNATVKAQAANLRRLTHLKEYARITAPFAASVTARTIERGALVSTTTALFKLAITDPIRVLVEVPQDVAPSVRSDVPARVRVREYGDRDFAGTVARASGALDSTTRTMTTEIRIKNEKGELMPGMYATASLHLPTPHRLLEIPATALMSDAAGTRVAVVDAQNVVHLQAISIENDMGATLQIAGGLTGDERIVKVVGAYLREGLHVEVVQ